MAKQIFVNLPVKNLEKSKDFYSNIGFTLNPKFSDETAACMVISDEIYTMLLTHPKFKEFTPKEIPDANKTSEVLNALSVDNRAEVDRLVDKALQNGGTEARPAEDLGFMYVRSFNDPDGHIWEFFWMDPQAMNGDSK